MIPLPRLELADHRSPFDEAVINIVGQDEDTITIELQDGGALDLADRLIRYVNAQRDVIRALQAAAHALRSYQFGNSATDLARDVAADCDKARQLFGEAA